VSHSLSAFLASLEASLLGKPLWMWLAFMGVVVVLLVLDLGVLHRRPRAIGVRESLWMSAFYISVALLFGAWVWIELGAEAGEEYLTGFLVEKTLALDNIFVISLIFAYFAVPPVHQHRVLVWGILGVIFLRAVMIALGAALVSAFSWTLYLFALFLVATGVKMLLMGEAAPDIAANPLLRACATSCASRRRPTAAASSCGCHTRRAAAARCG